MVEVKEKNKETDFSLGKPEEGHIQVLTTQVQETSALAKAQVEQDGTAETQRRTILLALRANQGACLRELSEITGIQKNLKKFVDKTVTVWNDCVSRGACQGNKHEIL